MMSTTARLQQPNGGQNPRTRGPHRPTLTLSARGHRLARPAPRGLRCRTPAPWQARYLTSRPRSWPGRSGNDESMTGDTQGRPRSTRPKGRSAVRWVAALAVLAWLAIGGVGGPLVGRLSEVATNDNANFLPPS